MGKRFSGISRRVFLICSGTGLTTPPRIGRSPHISENIPRGAQTRLDIEAPRLALPLGTLAALGEGQKPESAGSHARSRGGFGDGEMNHRLLPPTATVQQTIVVSGRTYSSRPGNAVDCLISTPSHFRLMAGFSSPCQAQQVAVRPKRK